MKNVVIIGAGISGLSLAWFLKSRYGSKIALTVVEASDRAGGWIETVRKDGFLFEMGPRSCRAAGAGQETLGLIEQLGMQSEVITPDPSARVRYLWKGGKLSKLPSGPLSLLYNPIAWRLIPACVRDLMTPASSLPDESIYDFFARRFGKAFAEDFADPMAKGIYAGDIRKLSIRSCFPLLSNCEKAQGSVIKGMLSRKKGKGKGLFSLRGGMERLTGELALRLKEHIVYNSKVVQVSCGKNSAAATLANGSVIEADRIFSTIPAPFFSGVEEGVSKFLSSISYSSVAVVGLGYRKKVLKQKGFGYLIPSKEKNQVLGVVWDSSVFPQQNQTPEETRLTVMIDAGTSGSFLEIAKKAISDQLGIDTEPDTFHIKIARHAIPQYHLGHSTKLKEAEKILAKTFPRLTLHGNSFHGVSVNDCIANSARIANVRT